MANPQGLLNQESEDPAAKRAFAREAESMVPCFGAAELHCAFSLFGVEQDQLGSKLKRIAAALQPRVECFQVWLGLPEHIVHCCRHLRSLSVKCSDALIRCDLENLTRDSPRWRISVHSMRSSSRRRGRAIGLSMNKHGAHPPIPAIRHDGAPRRRSSAFAEKTMTPGIDPAHLCLSEWYFLDVFQRECRTEQ
jgi:hypothetical protein